MHVDFGEKDAKEESVFSFVEFEKSNPREYHILHSSVLKSGNGRRRKKSVNNPNVAKRTRKTDAKSKTGKTLLN